MRHLRTAEGSAASHAVTNRLTHPSAGLLIPTIQVGLTGTSELAQPPVFKPVKLIDGGSSFKQDHGRGHAVGVKRLHPSAPASALTSAIRSAVCHVSGKRAKGLANIPDTFWLPGIYQRVYDGLRSPIRTSTKQNRIAHPLPRLRVYLNRSPGVTSSAKHSLSNTSRSTRSVALVQSLLTVAKLTPARTARRLWLKVGSSFCRSSMMARSRNSTAIVTLIEGNIAITEVLDKLQHISYSQGTRTANRNALGKCPIGRWNQPLARPAVLIIGHRPAESHRSVSPSDVSLAQQADARHEIELLSRRIRRLDHYREAHPDASEACKRLIWQERVNLWTEREMADTALQMLLSTPSHVVHRFDPDPLPEDIPSLEACPYVNRMQA